MALVTVRVASERLGVSYSTSSAGSTWARCAPRSPAAATTASLMPRSSACWRLNLPGRLRKAPVDRPDDTLAGLSARNRLRGLVEEVRVDGLLAQVRLRVGGQLLTAVITADAVQALHLKRGDEALAVIKSTEVMIARTASPPPPSRGGSKRRR